MKKMNIALLFFALLWGLSAKAQQQTQLFRFVHLSQSSNLKMALMHKLSSHEVELKELQSEEFSETTGYLQACIIKRIGTEKGRVLIASAKAPEYFLQYDASSNSLKFLKIAPGADLEPYTWELILNKESDTKYVALQSAVGSRLAVKVLPSNELELSSRAVDTALDQRFSFQLEKMSNVF